MENISAANQAMHTTITEKATPQVHVFEPDLCDFDPEYEVAMLPREQLVADPERIRKQFDAAALQSLSESIKRFGMMEALQVRKLSDERYQIVSGHRRFYASANILSTLPCVIMEPEDAEIWAPEANLQHEALSPVGKALAFQACKVKYGFQCDDDLAEHFGLSKSTMSLYMSLLKLPTTIFEQEKETPALPLRVLAKIARKSDEPEEKILASYHAEREAYERKGPGTKKPRSSAAKASSGNDIVQVRFASLKKLLDNRLSRGISEDERCILIDTLKNIDGEIQRWIMQLDTQPPAE